MQIELVRMRSPVRIWLSAPQKPRSHKRLRGFFYAKIFFQNLFEFFQFKGSKRGSKTQSSVQFFAHRVRHSFEAVFWLSSRNDISIYSHVRIQCPFLRAFLKHSKKYASARTSRTDAYIIDTNFQSTRLTQDNYSISNKAKKTT